jgi:carboxypeptidase C (cathepsin A)
MQDQPVQAGFSYDTLVNVTLNLAAAVPTPEPIVGKIPKQNNTFYVGTGASNKLNVAVNSTTNAARALWHFSQTFFQEFPEYKPNDNRISIWTESYGGRYGPETVAFFQQQNERILAGQIKDNSTQYMLKLDTLGIVNGCVDVITMQQFYPIMAYNNTYGLQTINETVYQEVVNSWNEPNGCLETVMACRAMAAELDPTNQGGNPDVNMACVEASKSCL